MNRRRLGRRLLLLLGVLALLVAPWTGLDRLHAHWFRGFVEVGIQVVAVGVRIDAVADAAAGGARDTAVHVLLTDGRGLVLDSWGTFASSRLVGFLPLVVFVALVLVTPLDPRRRWRTLLWGTLVLHGILLVRVGLYVLADYRQHLALCPRPELHAAFLRENPWVLRLASGVMEAIDGLALVHAFPVLVWLALTLRHTDWRALAPRSPETPPVRAGVGPA